MIVQRELATRWRIAFSYTLRCNVDSGVPGDIGDASFLGSGPARLLDVGSGPGKFVARDLSGPVSLYGFFDLTVGT